MIARRVLIYFLIATGVAVLTTVTFEIYALTRAANQAIDHHVLFTSSVARFVGEIVADEARLLDQLLAEFPPGATEQDVRARIVTYRALSLDGEGVAIVDDARRVVASSLARGGLPPAPVLLPALRHAEATGRFVVTDLWVGADHAPRVALIVGHRRDGAWRAAVMPMRLDREDFRRNFQYPTIDELARLQLLDSRGVALYSSRGEEQYASVVHGTYFSDQVRLGEPTAMRCHSCHENGADEPVRETEIMAVAPVPGTNWSVSVREERDAIFAPIHDIAYSSVAMVSVVIGAFVGFFVLLSRRVLKPIRQLVSAAARVAHGEAHGSALPDLEPKDEILSLAQTIEALRRKGEGVESTGEPVPPAPRGNGAGDLSRDELRKDLDRMLDSVLKGLVEVRPVCSSILLLDGAGSLPGYFGTFGARIRGPEPIRETLYALGNGRKRLSLSDLARRGVSAEGCSSICSFFVEPIQVSGTHGGQLWIGVSGEAEPLEPYLRPTLNLVASHIRHLVLRAVLYDQLRGEHEMKNRMLRHLFEAEDEERRRIAREIHDETAQMLDTLLVVLESLPGPEKAEKHAEGLKRAKGLVERILDETDRLIRRLRPAVLDDLGLVDAVQTTGENLLRDAGIQFDLQVESSGDEDLPKEAEVAVYRVFQEAMTNVLRHSGAKSVHAHLRFQPGRVVASIEDDGHGMDLTKPVDASDRPHWGLLGMRERIERLGGVIRFSSSDGDGVRIEFEVPVAAEVPAEPEV